MKGVETYRTTEYFLPIFFTVSISTISVGLLLPFAIYWVVKNKDEFIEETKKTILNTKSIEQKEETIKIEVKNLLKQTPAPNTPVSVSSKYFLFNGNHTTSYNTDSEGKLKISYELPNNFSYSSGDIKSVPLIASLRNSGIPDSSINSLLKTAVSEINIPITVETILSEENAVNDKKTIQIPGYIIDCSFVNLMSDISCGE